LGTGVSTSASRSTPGGPYRVYTTAFMGWLPPATAHCRLRPTAPGPASSMRQGGPGSGAAAGPQHSTGADYPVWVRCSSSSHQPGPPRRSPWSARPPAQPTLTCPPRRTAAMCAHASCHGEHRE
jgi:hypothetical protein